MANIIEINLQKTFKEYLDVKNYILQKVNKEQLDTDLAKEVISSNLSEDEIDDYIFEKTGWVQILNEDLRQLKIRLFHTYMAYKDLVEPPKELKEQIEEEIKEMTFKLTYSIKGDELTLVDKEAYEFYKKQFKEMKKLFSK